MKNSNNKINITYLIDSIGVGGAQTHVLNVLKNIDHDRFNVSVVCVRMPGSRFDQLKELPITPLVLNLENLTKPLATWKGYRKLSVFIREQRPSILHAYLFNPGLLAGLYRVLHPFGPQLMTSRRDVGYWHQRHHWWIYRILNIFTRHVITVTEDVRKTSMRMEKIRPSRISTIYNGVDTQFYDTDINLRQRIRAQYSLTDDHLVIGILAILRAEKRHDIFIQAASILAKKFPNLRFMIVGGNSDDDCESAIRAQVKRGGIQDKVIFTGKVTSSKPSLSAFDISVLCSDTEGMSNTLLESISMSLPVVVTDVGGNPEVVENGVNGVLFPAGDAQALARGLSAFIESGEMRKRFSTAARQRALTTFSMEKMVNNMESMYEQIITQ